MALTIRKKPSVGRVRILSTLMMTLALMLQPMYGVVAGQVANATSIVTVSPRSLQSWAAPVNVASPTFVSGPAGVSGNGSLKLSTDADEKQAFMRATESMPLSDANGMAYSLFVQTGIPASYQMYVTGTSGDTDWTYLVWEPTYNGHPNGPNGAFTNHTNLRSGTWWSSKSISGAPDRSTFVDFQTIVDANPDAVVRAVGVNVGSGTPNANSYVDTLSFNGTTYDFEQDAGVVGTAFVTKSDAKYAGVFAEFSVSNFTDAEDAYVTIERLNGGDVIKRVKNLNLINGANGTITAPFAINEGTYRDDGSSSWFAMSPNSWTLNTVPTFAYMTVVTPNGSVESNKVPLNSTSGPSYASLLPPDEDRPQLRNISITPQIKGNIGGTVVVTFDLEDETGVDLTKTRVLFADGPNTPNAKRESAKYVPQLVGGNTYQVKINTFDFVKANWTGEYSLAFNLWDTLGNQGSSKPMTKILIDNSGPTSTWVAPANGSPVKGLQRFSFDVTDHTGVQSGWVQLNGLTTKRADLAYDSISETWYADINTDELAEGSYTVDARFVDSFNRPRYDANKGVVTIDRTVPTFSLTDDGSPRKPILNGAVINPDRLGDRDGDNNSIRFSKESVTDILFLNDSPIFGHGFTTGRSGQIGAAFRGEGTYTLYTRDQAGNQSESITISVDKTAPTATFSYSNSNGSALTSQDVIVTMTASERIQAPAGWAPVGEGGKIFTRTYANNGKYEVTVTDVAGNVSVPQKFEVKRIDRNAPTIVGITDGAIVSGTVELIIFDPKYEGYDGFDKLHGLTVNGTKTPTVEGPGKTFLYTTGDEGQYTVVATDKAGNATTVKFTIDSTAPIVTLDGVTEGEAYESPVTIRGTIDEENLSNYYLTVTKDGVNVRIPDIARSGSASSIEFTLNEAGSYIVKLEAIDKAGNKDGHPRWGDGDSVKTVSFSIVAPVLGEGDEGEEEGIPGGGNQNTQGGTGTQNVQVIVPPQNLFANIFPQPLTPPSIPVESVDADQSGAGDDTDNDGSVLGEQDQGGTPLADTGDVLGVMDSKLFGIAWYWWLGIVAALVAGWLAFAAAMRRRREDEL